MKNLNLLLANYHRHKNPNEVVFKRHDGVTLNLLTQDYFDCEKISALDRKALDMAQGDVLVIYGSTGRYSLELQKKGMNVHSINPAKEIIDLKIDQGVQGVIDIDVLEFTGLEFDTLLVLGDSTIRLSTMGMLNQILKHSVRLLNEGGCLLFRSVDPQKAKDGEMPFAHDATATYAGEIVCHVPFEGADGDEIKLLFVGFETLKKCAGDQGLSCELVDEIGAGYLAKLTKP